VGEPHTVHWRYYGMQRATRRVGQPFSSSGRVHYMLPYYTWRNPETQGIHQWGALPISSHGSAQEYRTVYSTLHGSRVPLQPPCRRPPTPAHVRGCSASSPQCSSPPVRCLLGCPSGALSGQSVACGWEYGIFLRFAWHGQ
jgi:hypothetical protein